MSLYFSHLTIQSHLTLGGLLNVITILTSHFENAIVLHGHYALPLYVTPSPSRLLLLLQPLQTASLTLNTMFMSSEYPVLPCIIASFPSIAITVSLSASPLD